MPKLNKWNQAQETCEYKYNSVLHPNKCANLWVYLEHFIRNWRILAPSDRRLVPIILFNQFHRLKTCLPYVLVLDLNWNGDLLGYDLEDLLQRRKAVLIFVSALVIQELTVFVQLWKMHGHFSLKLGQVCKVGLLDETFDAAETRQWLIMAHSNHAILGHAHISLKELGSVLQGVFEGLQGILWLLPAAASMRHDHLVKVAARLWHLQLRPPCLQ